MSDTLKFNTFIEWFYHREKTTPDQVYLRQPKGDQWKEYTWGEVGKQARKIAAALKDMGLQKGDHIGLVSKNCAHWIIADTAILMGGYVGVPFYSTLSGKQLAEVIELSDVKALFVGKLEVWNDMKSGVPEGMPAISFPHYKGNDKVEGMIKWKDLLDKHKPIKDAHVPSPEDMFTIIYTSGTTGTPKGVMLNFKAIHHLLENERKYNYFNLFKAKNPRYFSYLPLNHIAEKNLIHIASMYTGGTVSFAENLASFPKNLSETSPTIFFAVPRIWTKFQMGILANMPEKKLDRLLKIPILSGIVKKKIRKKLGINDALSTVSGAAPLPVSLQKFFAKIDVLIQEVYGMTETCGGISVMPRTDIKQGTVGKPMHGADVTIDKDTGEIISAAPWNMMGYYKSPEKTNEVVVDGKLHSGDKGELTPDGYLKITGRVKDTFKSAKGKYIIPNPIEKGFTKNANIEQICVVGRGIPQPLAMICLSDDAKKKPKEEIAESLIKTMDTVNSEMPGYMHIHTLIVCGEPWSIENNMLTPTLKIKRNQVDDKYCDCYDGWYEDKEKVIWEGA